MILTSVSASFSSTSTLSLIGSTITLTAEVFTSPTPDDVYTAVPGAICTMAPALTGILTVGTLANCITTGLSIPVTAQTKVIVVVTATVTAGLDVNTTVEGGVSVGVSAV
jgi:BclB C-terminal domain-containing protein